MPYFVAAPQQDKDENLLLYKLYHNTETCRNLMLAPVVLPISIDEICCHHDLNPCPLCKPMWFNKTTSDETKKKQAKRIRELISLLKAGPSSSQPSEIKK